MGAASESAPSRRRRCRRSAPPSNCLRAASDVTSHDLPIATLPIAIQWQLQLRPHAPVIQSCETALAFICRSDKSATWRSCRDSASPHV